MARKSKKKPETMIDKDGYEVPIKYIDPLDIERHKMVEANHEDMLVVEQVVRDRLEKVRKRTKEYLVKTANKYGEEWQGNATLYNFPENKKTIVQASKVIEFNEKLQVAKSKIDKCMLSWSKDSNNYMQQIIKKAFNVDKKGNIDTKQILGLREHKFEDKEWNEAMKLISEAIFIRSIREHILQYIADPNAKDGFRIISPNANKK